MFTRIRNLHPVTGIVIGVVATLVLSGTALAVTDASFTYSTVQTGYLMVGPADLVPTSEISADNYSLSDTSASSSYSNNCFVAGVHLPQGARVTTVRTSFSSGAGDNNIFITLTRVNPLTPGRDYLVSHYVANDAGSRTYVNDVVPATLRLVNNALYTYTYEVCVGSSTYFYGARITYQYTSAGD